jgi:hypothetical protein
MDGMEFVIYAAEIITDEESARQAAEMFNQTFLVEPAWTFSIWFDTTCYAIGTFLGISE